MDPREQACKLCLDKTFSDYPKNALRYLSKYRNIKDFFNKNEVGILFLPICREPRGKIAGPK